MFYIQHIEKTLSISKALSRFGCRFILPDSLYKKMAEHNNKICHIIGSGWSLNKSIALVNKNDYIIGFNFSAFYSMPFNMYFIEANEDKEINQTIYQLAIDVVCQYTDNVFFKNIWEIPHVLETLVPLYKEKVMFIRDVIIMPQNVQAVPDTVRFMLQKDSLFIKQTCSTVLTCITCAAIAGFKKIVLHGIDFWGPYFFDMENFHNKSTIKLPPTKYTSKRPIKYSQLRQYTDGHGPPQPIPLFQYLTAF
jgi:hypothetical protein